MEVIHYDEVKAIVAATKTSKGHKSLITALHKRYPDLKFSLVAIRGGWSSIDGAIIDAAGNRVSESYRDWMLKEFETCGRRAKVVWDKHQDKGLFVTETIGETIYVLSPFATHTDAFFQIQIDAIQEVIKRPLFDPKPWRFPRDLDDLIDPMMGSSENPAIITPMRYQLDKITNIRRFMRDLINLEHSRKVALIPEMEQKKVQVVSYGGTEAIETKEIPYLDLFPNWLTRLPREVRIFQDWDESSAGKSGNRFYNHWALQLNDYTPKDDGCRRMSFIPIWADKDGRLPHIVSSKCKTVYALLDKLEQFDKRAGYPMAWFFYMLHGNRLGYATGERIVSAIQDGKINLPENDVKVLFRWYDDQYGF